MLRGLAQYQVLKCLAKGSQGTVYLAMDTRLSRRVCIKLYSLQGSLGERHRAVAEAWQLTRVDSPRTLTVFDVVAQGESLALVTEYVAGCNLADFLGAETPLPISNALAIVSDIAAALAGLRQAKLVHGDLSARNVLIDLSGRAVLADFGVVSWSGDLPLGMSTDAMSPEQSRGQATDLRSDFFALGILLYRMLFSRHPFCPEGELDHSLLCRGLRDVPPVTGLEPIANAGIASLLLALMAPEPDERPAGTYELREQLRMLRAQVPAPESLRTRVQNLSRSKPPIETPLRLPRKLVSLPMRRHFWAWVLGYWRSGTLGARGLLLASFLVPALVAVLLVARPGPCLIVNAPSIESSPLARALFPDSQRLQEVLTLALKSSVRHASVLGLGKASDSRVALSVTGTRDICVAQRSLDLRVECATDRCILQLQGRTPQGANFSDVTLLASSGQLAVDDALKQLVLTQIDFLTDG